MLFDEFKLNGRDFRFERYQVRDQASDVKAKILANSRNVEALKRSKEQKLKEVELKR